MDPSGRKRALLMFFCIAILLASCDKLIQYHPNEIRLDAEDKNLNAKNIDKILQLPAKDSFKFVVIGDTQRFYDELDDFVSTLNQRNDISFVIINGDITDFGINKEYKWISRSLRKLNVPFIGVIGNHDMLANGRDIYNLMFGVENFSYTYSGHHFVCINTNALEDGFEGTIPDINWLSTELAKIPNGEEAFVFSHIPPFDGDFDPILIDPYINTLRASGRVNYSIHGHQHRYSLGQPYGPDLNFLVVADMNKRNYVVVNVKDGIQSIEQVAY